MIQVGDGSEAYAVGVVLTQEASLSATFQTLQSGIQVTMNHHMTVGEGDLVFYYYGGTPLGAAPVIARKGRSLLVWTGPFRPLTADELRRAKATKLPRSGMAYIR